MKTNLLILLAVTLLSCNPYKKIATDINRSDKNTKLLSQVCETAFPSQPATFIKGETIVKIDTIKQSDSIEIKRLLNLLLQEGNKEMNVDSLYLVFKSTIKPIKIIIDNSRVDTFETPPNKYEIYRLNTVISHQGEQIIRDEETIRHLTAVNKKNKFAKFSGWAVLFALVGAYLFVKLKLK